MGAEHLGLARLRGFPKLGDTLLGVPIMRIIVFGCLYWDPIILGNYHFTPCDLQGKMLLVLEVRSFVGQEYTTWHL